jgi:hypothetical protein
MTQRAGSTHAVSGLRSRTKLLSSTLTLRSSSLSLSLSLSLSPMLAMHPRHMNIDPCDASLDLGARVLQLVRFVFVAI